MSTHKLPAIALALGLASSAAFSAGPNLGIPLEPADIAAWDISIMPDGTGLPIGGGTPAQGAHAQPRRIHHPFSGQDLAGVTHVISACNANAAARLGFT